MSPGERESGRSLSDNKLDSDGNQTGRWPCRPARPVSPLLHSVPQQPGAWCWAVTPVSQTGRLSPERRDDFPKVTQSVRGGNVSGCLLSPSVHPIDGDSHYAGPEVSPFFAFCQWCRDFLRFILQPSLIFFSSVFALIHAVPGSICLFSVFLLSALFRHLHPGSSPSQWTG